MDANNSYGWKMIQRSLYGEYEYIKTSFKTILTTNDDNEIGYVADKNLKQKDSINKTLNLHYAENLQTLTKKVFTGFLGSIIPHYLNH